MRPLVVAFLAFWPPRKVVVGVGPGRSAGGHSLGSLAALRKALTEARRDRQPLVAVTAWQPPGGEYAYRTAPTPPLEHVWAKEARRRLADAFDEAVGGLPADVEVRPEVVRGPAAEVLCAEASGPDDLLVIGGGPRSWWARLFHGVVRRRVLARAGCPVLVVAPPSEPRGSHRAFRHADPDDFAPPVSRPGGSRPYPGNVLC